jgi:hypothetical protein
MKDQFPVSRFQFQVATESSELFLAPPPKFLPKILSGRELRHTNLLETAQNLEPVELRAKATFPFSPEANSPREDL